MPSVFQFWKRLTVLVTCVLEEIGTRGGKRVGLAGEGSGQTREGALEVDTSLYTRKMYVNQGGEWKDSGRTRDDRKMVLN